MRMRWNELLVVSLFWFAIEFSWQSLTAIMLPMRVIDLSGAASKGTTLALLLGLGALVSIVVQPAVGALSDSSRSRFGRRRPFIATGAVGLMVGLALLPRAVSLPSLAAGLLLLYLAVNIAQAPVQGLIPDLVPAEQHGAASGYMAEAGLAGAVLGPLTAGYLVRDGNVAPAATAALLVVAVLLAVTLAAVREEPGPGGQLGLAQRLRLVNRLEPARHRPFYTLLACRFFMLLALGTILTFLLFFLKDAVGLAQPARGAGLVIGVAGFSGLLAALPSAHLSDCLGRKAPLLAGGLLALLAAVLLMFGRSFTLVLLAAPLVGAALGIWSGVHWAYMLDFVPRLEAARFLGYSQMVTSLSLILAPLSAGPIIDAFADRPDTGYRILYALATLYIVVSLLLLTRVPRSSSAAGG